MHSLNLLGSILLGLSLHPATAFAQPIGTSQTVGDVQASLVIPAETSYTLGAGDLIQVDLFRVPQYSGQQEVQVDGSVNLPLVGPVLVADMSLEEASTVISTAYSQLLRRPIVTLSIVRRRPVEIGVAGEVLRPGSYTLSAENANFPTLTQLLETAGGITQSADLRQVQVQRQHLGGLQRFTVNLWELLQTGDLRYDIALRDGDSVFIPSTVIPLEEGSILADASFYADLAEPINIAVIGEVFRPGPYTLQGGGARTANAGVPGSERSANSPSTVTDAIQLAGGIKPRADIRQIQVRRLTRGGEEQFFKVDLWQMLQVGDLNQNAILQDGDTVIVPAVAEVDPLEATQIAAASFSPNTIRVNIVGEVANSGVVEIPPNTPLNQAIMAAGGFNTRANESSVQLIRLNPDGTVLRRDIPIDFAQGINEERNPALQNNDIVVVGKSGLANVSDTFGTIVSPLADFLFILGAPFRAVDFFD